jgi:AcrR family transcriptional regulator
MKQKRPPSQRADAERNRDKILKVARAAFAESGGQISMAEIARRAGVGMATVYRNFPGQRELLEALYTSEVDVIVEAAAAVEGETAGEALRAWLYRFVAFFTNKHPIGTVLLADLDSSDPVFTGSRARVLDAGRPLLVAAQQANEARADISIEQILDMIIAISSINEDLNYCRPMLRVALDGLAPVTAKSV